MGWYSTPRSSSSDATDDASFYEIIGNPSSFGQVNGELWDLDRPFEKASTLALIKFDDDEGKMVFWHSSAHILGEAMERCYGCNLCYGPPIEEGFYYDMAGDEGLR